jgi:uncharacterized protein YpmS
MRLDEFKKLAESIDNQDFRTSYKNINTVMLILSVFGHITSIFLAYFLLSKILSGAIEDGAVLVAIISIVILTGLEALKRDFFEKFSFQFLKHKNLFSKDVLPLFITSFLIVSMSFYASIKGAQEFSTKSKQIEQTKKNEVSTISDSLNKEMNIKLIEIDNEVKGYKKQIADKDVELTSLESSTDPLTSQQRGRIKYLKKEKDELRSQVSLLEEKSNKIKSEVKEKIDNFAKEKSEETVVAKQENEGNSYLFVIISTLVELTILFGVYFNKYYKFRSYSDFKQKIEKDSNYQRWYNYDRLLDIIYSKELKVNDKLPPIKNMVEFCKMNGIRLTPKDMSDFLKLMTNIGVFKTQGSVRYIQKTKELALEALREHFNIK